MKWLYLVMAVSLIVYIFPSLVSALYLNLGNVALNRVLVESAGVSSPDYRPVLDNFHRALSWNPRNSQVYWAVGLAYETAGDEAQALEAWTHMMGDYQRLLILADATCERGDCERALDLYKLVSASSPGSTEVHCRMGEAYRRLGDLDSALLAYREGVEVASASPGGATAPVSCHLGMGQVYAQNGDWRAAIYQFERVLRLPRFYHPEALYRAYLRLGGVYRAQDRYSEAVEAFRGAIAVRPRDRRAYVELARVYLMEERVEDAVREYLRAIELDPEKAWLHIELGDVYRAQSAVGEAVAAYQRALELEPDNAEAKGRLEEMGEGGGRMEGGR